MERAEGRWFALLDEEVKLKKRILELAEKSYRNNMYVHTNFLNPAEYSICVQALEQEHLTYDSFGGNEACERKIIRFGSEEELGYEQPYPIACVIIKPALAKFAEQLGHRDYLGSILNLGIERDVIGDILIRNQVGYVLCLDSIAPFLTEHLTKIKHTSVRCEQTDVMPDEIRPVLEAQSLTVASLRCDLIIAKLYHLSRSEAVELFREKKVAVNGRIEENNSKSLNDGDVISARGYGKFVYQGVKAKNKKEKLCVNISVYK